MTTSRNQDLWIVPGGGIEPTEDPRVAALREVQEEAGAKGDLGRCLGVFEVLATLLHFLFIVFISHRFLCILQTFVMHSRYSAK